MIHNTALNSTKNLPFYPPDNHYRLVNVYLKGGIT